MPARIDSIARRRRLPFGAVSVALLVAVSAALVVGAADGMPRRAAGAEHVVLIGDSVADGIVGDSDAISLLSGGIDLQLEVAPCRRVDGVSCPYEGTKAPSVVDLARAQGSKLGPNVVVAVGYNDFESVYAQNIETALAAFKADGVKRVWWLTLRAVRHPYLTMNDAIEAAAAKHPELSVIEWNVYSRSHPDWFQLDGLHLREDGAFAMATLIHKTLVSDGIAAAPVRVLTATLPTARRGHPYETRLRATAGVQPYRWSLLERAPPGIHLRPAGLVQGTPRAKPGRYRFDVKVRDSSGYSATRQLTLRVAA